MMEQPLERHLQAAQREVRVRGWGPARVEASWRKLAEKDPNVFAPIERLTRVGGMALAVAAVVALGLVTWRSLRPIVAGSDTVATTASRMPIQDGVEAELDSGSKVHVREKTASRVVVAVQAGMARFRVRHDPTRLFRVEAGGVVVEDLGTIFAVEQREATVMVSVTEGAVAVSFPDPTGTTRITKTLVAGESGTYPSTAPRAPEAAVAPTDLAVPAPSAAVAKPAESQAQADWRELQRAGKHRRAYDLLAPSGFRDVRDEPGDLLLASDVARLSNHPAESAMLLRRLLASHSRDPRAPSAAFTLGWVLMNELGRPREASRAFAQAESLAPRGNLAEDALARTVEAWSRAGERSRAKAELERYRKTYQRGRHLATLERLLREP
jgi:transmembrane sensor